METSYSVTIEDRLSSRRDRAAGRHCRTPCPWHRQRNMSHLSSVLSLECNAVADVLRQGALGVEERDTTMMGRVDESGWVAKDETGQADDAEMPALEIIAEIGVRQ